MFLKSWTVSPYEKVHFKDVRKGPRDGSVDQANNRVVVWRGLFKRLNDCGFLYPQNILHKRLNRVLEVIKWIPLIDLYIDEVESSYTVLLILFCKF